MVLQDIFTFLATAGLLIITPLPPSNYAPSPDDQLLSDNISELHAALPKSKEKIFGSGVTMEATMSKLVLAAILISLAISSRLSLKPSVTTLRDSLF